MSELKTVTKGVKKVAIVGLGHVGLVLALFFCEKGLDVVGVDINENLVKKIASGESPVRETDVPQLMKEYVERGRLRPTTNISEISDTEVILVTVGTPLRERYTPNLKDIKTASSSVGSFLEKGHIVVIKSTVVPGTTEDIIKPILEEKSGLKAGEDFILAYCPERLAEGGSMKDFRGSALEDVKKIPIVVGGSTPADTKIVCEFWKRLGLETIEVSGLKEAEMVKLADNLWIDLNIALANEIAMLSEKLGVDALEVISAANTLPKGQNKVNILFPGPGVGGYCLPKDPWFVYYLGKQHGLDLKTPKVSREVNDSMPKHVFNIILDVLDGFGKKIGDSKVTVLGLAFKNSTGDMRNSPAKPLIDLLKNNGANISAFDLWVNKEEAKKIFGVKPAESLEEAVKLTDCIVLISAHPEFRRISFEEIKNLTSPQCGVVDGRAAFAPKKVTDAGFLYRRVGLGRRSSG